MNTNKAIEKILEYKGDSLKIKLTAIKFGMIGKTKSEVRINTDLFNAALKVKRASAQINEIVHALGIINTLPIILNEGEIIQDLSLASGKEGDGFDLETNQRVAEFKFAKWQEGGSKNGMRKRQVFGDFVNLTMLDTQRKKELYVVSAQQITKYFNGRANWKKVLDKNKLLTTKFASYLRTINKREIKQLREVYALSDVQIFDLETLVDFKEN